jgi:hypothetical protein
VVYALADQDSANLWLQPIDGSTGRKMSDMAIFHQLGSGVLVTPFAKSELLY